MAFSSAWRALLVVAVGLLSSAVYKAYRQRKLFRDAVKEYGGVSTLGPRLLGLLSLTNLICSLRFLITHGSLVA